MVQISKPSISVWRVNRSLIWNTQSGTTRSLHMFDRLCINLACRNSQQAVIALANLYYYLEEIFVILFIGNCYLNRPSIKAIDFSFFQHLKLSYIGMRDFKLSTWIYVISLYYPSVNRVMISNGRSRSVYLTAHPGCWVESRSFYFLSCQRVNLLKEIMF